MLQEKQYRREVAQKASVAEILNNAEAEGGTASLNANGRQIKRANVLATIVDKTDTDGAYKSMVADDGTGQIRLRLFDDAAGLFGKTEIGDFALIIGKPRHYGDETYIAPELIRALKEIKWADVRKLELRIPRTQQKIGLAENLKENEKPLPNDDGVSKDKVKVYQAIKELDTGRGADVTEVVLKCGSNTETLVKEMIRSGDLFEVSPGRLKVLE